MSARFEPSREDGRSDRQVVVDLVEEHQPDDVLSHAEILAALREGTDREIGPEHVYRAAGAASRWLIKNEKKALVTMRGQGYRISVPDDFHSLTLVRRDRASTQLNRGREVLENAPLDGMTEAVREAMVPLTILIGGAYAQLHAHQQRLKRHEGAILDLADRVKKLEGEE